MTDAHPARAALDAAIRAEVHAPPDDPDLAALVDAIRARARRPAAVAAVLFYGSGLWQGLRGDQVLDFYVLVGRLRDFDPRPGLAVLGRGLPPNVYYIEAEVGVRPLRAKCAVMTLDAFAAATAGRAATPQIWARFAQPCRIVHAADATAEAKVMTALGDAVVTLHRKLLPLLPAGLDLPEVWRRMLAETYGRELRSEGRTRAAAVFQAAPAALTIRSRCAVPLSGTGAVLDDANRLARPARRGLRWRARTLAPLARTGGKAVTLLRLMKASVTFDGGVDYILWKIERHSGVRVPVSDFARRHPLIGGWPVLIRLYRRGAFR